MNQQLLKLDISDLRTLGKFLQAGSVKTIEKRLLKSTAKMPGEYEEIDKILNVDRFVLLNDRIVCFTTDNQLLVYSINPLLLLFKKRFNKDLELLANSSLIILIGDMQYFFINKNFEIKVYNETIKHARLSEKYLVYTVNNNHVLFNILTNTIVANNLDMFACMNDFCLVNDSRIYNLKNKMFTKNDTSEIMIEAWTAAADKYLYETDAHTLLLHDLQSDSKLLIADMYDVDEYSTCTISATGSFVLVRNQDLNLSIYKITNEVQNVATINVDADALGINDFGTVCTSKHNTLYIWQPSMVNSEDIEVPQFNALKIVNRTDVDKMLDFLKFVQGQAIFPDFVLYSLLIMSFGLKNEHTLANALFQNHYTLAFTLLGPIVVFKNSQYSEHLGRIKFIDRSPEKFAEQARIQRAYYDSVGGFQNVRVDNEESESESDESMSDSEPTVHKRQSTVSNSSKKFKQ